MIKRVTDVITIEQIKTWTNKDLITITAGTGVGKSYFIKNVLYAFAKANNKKILFLIHRSQCVEQFQKEIESDNKQDTIDIKTYQSIETIGIYNNTKDNGLDFSQYSYIVCDEFHYFISDASFSKMTDIGLNIILNSNITKIFMSATGNHTKNYLNINKNLTTKDYEIPINYEFIDNLYFYYKEDTTEELIKRAIGKNLKAIFFIQSAKEAYSLYKKYKDYCLFNCSKSNKKYYEYVDKEKINNMLVNQKFDELILITTSCMDAGVNIIDSELNNIVCDIKDIYTMLQCIGRKRLQHKDDKINVYIKALSNRQLGGMKSSNKNKIKKAEFLKKNGTKLYLEEYPRENDYDEIIYDVLIDGDKCTKKINELRLYKCKMDIKDINNMLSCGKWGYCTYLSNLFNKEYIVLEEENKTNKLEYYLEEISGKKLFKEQQKELIDKIGLRDARGRLQKSVGLLNNYLEVNKYKYVILQKTTKDKNRKNIRYWIIENLIEK